ncbi:MAG: hypothetical protein ACYC8S_02020 [Minisyncoccota bacterium]
MINALINGTLPAQTADAAQASYNTNVLPFLQTIAPTLEVIAAVLILSFIAIISYSMVKFRHVRKREHHHYKPVEHIENHAVNTRRAQWEIILDHANSDNVAEWKVGIIEADKLLEEVLEEHGYHGATLGERLKIAEGRLRSLNSAWEAHKVRNQVAHEGGFELTKRSTRDCIAKYGTVFEEMHVI